MLPSEMLMKVEIFLTTQVLPFTLFFFFFFFEFRIMDLDGLLKYFVSFRSTQTLQVMLFKNKKS